MVRDDDVIAAKATLESYVLDFEVSRAFVRQFLKDNHHLVYKGRDWGWYDTVIVSELANTLSRALLNRNWPRYKDNMSDKEMKNLQQELKDAIAKRGEYV